MNKKIPLLVICGPTATGKTKLSIDIAKEKNGEIISADSMQIYKGMDIGTAKPSLCEMQGIKHYLIDEIEPNENFSVARFKELAQKYILEIRKKNKLPIIVGGTGLYISSLVENVKFGDFQANYSYREELSEKAKTDGGIVLKEMLYKVDTVTAQILHENDIKRLIRALEIFKITGQPQSYWVEQSKKEEPPYNSLIIGLTYSDRGKLYEKINQRVDEMINKGLIDEVKSLLAKGLDKYATSMQAIGYKELAKYLSGEENLSQAIDKIKQESRRYAKRQLTWFRRDKSIKWIEIDEIRNFEKIKKIFLKYMENFGF